MRKQGVRLLGPENGEAIWVGCPSPEGTVQCPKTTELGAGHYWGRVWMPGRAKALGS